MDKEELFDKEYVSDSQTSAKPVIVKELELVPEEEKTDVSKYTINKPKRRIIKAKIINDKS